MYSSSRTPSSMIAIRHSTGCETLMSISLFMLTWAFVYGVEEARFASRSRAIAIGKEPCGARLWAVLAGNLLTGNAFAARVRPADEPLQPICGAEAGSSTRKRPERALTNGRAKGTAWEEFSQRTTHGPSRSFAAPSKAICPLATQ